MEHNIKTLRNHLRYLRKEYGVKSLAICGSYARGEHKESSDVDILVEFSKPIGLKFISLADYLEKILGK
ncbi:MAG: nucleotidyltransferase domain-containing protein, partial [Aquificaceae bacterium]|nr:nucleotidyltransferase domain-containing protein [Aquificaceae bacterium]